MVVRVCAITFDWYPFDPLVRRMAESAVDAGHEVDVICLRQPGEAKYERCNGVRTFRVPMNRGFGASLPATLLSWCWFLILAAFMVTKLHLQRSYDVIHVHNMPDFLVFATLIPKLSGAKIVLEVQDTCPELMAAKAQGPLRGIVQFLAVLQERISTAYSDHVITVGWPFEKLLLQRGVPAHKMTIILNSADPRIFPPSHRPPLPDRDTNPERPFIVMYHGTIAVRTGLDIAIRALAEARQQLPNIRLHIKGRGEFLPYLQQLATDLSVLDAIEFTDPCPAEEIVDFIVQGDVGIIPYRNDGFEELVLPTKAYEFAWMHRPIIASNTVGIRSMFRPASIVLCEPENPTSFATAIIDLYYHPEKRAQMILDAMDDYTPYKWEIMSDRYCQMLVKLSRKYSRGRSPAEQKAI